MADETEHAGLEALRRRLEDEDSAYAQALAALEARARALTARVAALETRNSELTQSHRQAITTVAEAEGKTPSVQWSPF